MSVLFVPSFFFFWGGGYLVEIESASSDGFYSIHQGRLFFKKATYHSDSHVKRRRRRHCHPKCRFLCVGSLKTHCVTLLYIYIYIFRGQNPTWASYPPWIPRVGLRLLSLPGGTALTRSVPEFRFFGTFRRCREGRCSWQAEGSACLGRPGSGRGFVGRACSTWFFSAIWLQFLVWGNKKETTKRGRMPKQAPSKPS